MKKSITVILSVLFLANHVFGQTGLGFQAVENSGQITIVGYTGNEKNLIIPGTANGFPIVAIGDEAFRDKQLTSVTIGNSVTTIGNSAFTNNRLTSVIIPDSVTTIGEMAFTGNRLTSVTIGANVRIDSGAFDDSFLSAYNGVAGTYIRPSASSSRWTKGIFTF